MQGPSVQLCFDFLMHLQFFTVDFSEDYPYLFNSHLVSLRTYDAIHDFFSHVFANNIERSIDQSCVEGSDYQIEIPILSPRMARGATFPPLWV